MTNPTKIKSLLDRIERVETSALKVHPRNPRRGDVDRIAASLEANSQYRPIVVQEKTGYIIAGNHTYLGARKLGWTHLDVVKVDVNDKAARKIMLADNRTSDAGSYDDDILAEVLRSLEGDVEGTGYYDQEIDRIISGVSEAAESTLKDFESTDLQRRFNESPMGAEADEELARREESSPGDFAGGELAGGEALNVDETPGIEMADASLGGMYNLKVPDEVDLPSIGYWGITELDQSKLMRFDELPEKLVTWAESFSRNKIDPHANDPETWWFYNWGMSSTQGMDDVSKVIISFYSHDETFEMWWAYPERYAAKMLNSKVKYMVTPDYSMIAGGAPVVNLWNIYRQRWLGRYMQECGIRIIPNVDWPMGDVEFMRKHVVGTLPVGLPMIALQFQTMDKESIDKHCGGIDNFREQHQEMLDTLKPQGVLLYAGNPGKKFFLEELKYDGPVKVLDSRLVRLGEFDQVRKRKKGI